MKKSAFKFAFFAFMTVMLAVFAANTYGQDLPMISSKDALRVGILKQVTSVNASIGTALPTGTDSFFGFVPVESPTAVGISNTISRIRLSVNVANPNDFLYVNAGAYNSDGDMLFDGSHQFKLESGEDGYALPADYGDVTMDMAYEVPIRLNGAVSAQVNIFNSAGQTELIAQLRVQDGKVYFPKQLAGTNGVLSVNIPAMNKEGRTTEKWYYWSVSSGAQIQPERVTIALQTTIRGIVSIKDNDVLVMVPTTNSIGNNVIAELESTGKPETVAISFWTTEGKWFRGAWVYAAGSAEPSWYAPIADKERGMMVIGLPVQAGIYYIVPAWNDGDLVEPRDAWYPPYPYGGGKG